MMIEEKFRTKRELSSPRKRKHQIRVIYTTERFHLGPKEVEEAVHAHFLIQIRTTQRTNAGHTLLRFRAEIEIGQTQQTTQSQRFLAVSGCMDGKFLLTRVVFTFWINLLEIVKFERN